MGYFHRILTIALLCAALATPGISQEAEEAKAHIAVGKSPCFFFSTGHKRGTLGVHLTDLTPELRAHFGSPADAGVMVSKVVKESPAAEAGIEVGDIITAVDDEEISSSRELSRTIRKKKQSDVVEVSLVRDRQLMTLSATIQESNRSEIDLGGMSWEDCDELEMDFTIDEEAIRDAVEDATRQFRSPEWRSRWRWLERFDEVELQEKMKELEERLQELEKELKEKYDERYK